MATAAPAVGWLLVELPGPWGRHALRQSRLSSEVGARLQAVCAERSVRIQVIRRPPERGQPPRCRRWAYVDSAARPQPTAWWGEYRDDEDLLKLSLDGSQGTPSTEPIMLVCTHARHDACCALLGRPAYSALASQHPAHTWETSHVGGDRFAANLVILPEGLYYGGLDGDSGITVVAVHLAGLIDPAHYRGASTQPAPTQAAEHFLRAHLDEYRLSALVPVHLSQLDRNVWVARLAHLEGAEFDVEVRTTHGAALSRLTCSAGHPAALREFELLSLREVPPA